MEKQTDSETDRQKNRTNYKKILLYCARLAIREYLREKPDFIKESDIDKQKDGETDRQKNRDSYKKILLNRVQHAIRVYLRENKMLHERQRER